MILQRGWRAAHRSCSWPSSGPGFITANVDNDAGGIWTYSVAGAQFGYSLLWVDDPDDDRAGGRAGDGARMGAVTGKGLSDLIREEFGFRVTFLLMLALVITNFGNVMAEFAGVASSLELFGISRYIVVPAGGGRRLAAGGAGHVQQRREDLPRRLAASTSATSSRACWRIRTGRAATFATVTRPSRAKASGTTATSTW